MTMLFMAGSKAKFASKDADKYAKRHMPLLKEAYGDSVQRIELRMASASTMGIDSQILASSTIWISSVPDFIGKLSANATKINTDLDSIVKANRQVQIDRIALELGDPLDQVPDNADVFSHFYPSRSAPIMGPGRGGGMPGAGGGVTFDEKYYLEAFLPRLFSEHGSTAVRRLEATMGMDQGGQPADQKAAYHLVIRDRNTYSSGAQRIFQEMQRDSSKFMQGILPFFSEMKIVAVA
jgi:hypothetical protein